MLGCYVLLIVGLAGGAGLFHLAGHLLRASTARKSAMPSAEPGGRAACRSSCFSLCGVGVRGSCVTLSLLGPSLVDAVLDIPIVLPRW